MQYNGKEVLQFGNCVNLVNKNDPSSIWKNGYSRYRSWELLPCKIETFKEKVNSLKAELKPNSILYFGKSSDFPRFKLAESGFKRCIKLDKANFVVLGKFNLDEYRSDYYILEDEKYVYLLSSGAYNNLYYKTPLLESKEFSQDPVAYLKKNHSFFGTTLNLIYKGPICACKEGEDAIKIMDGTYKNIIFDAELDSAINAKNDTLDPETVKSVCELLDSPDKESKALGLKLLIGFNANATPLTIRTMLSLRPALAELSEWTGVGVKQVLETIKFRGFARFPYRLYNIVSNDDSFDSYTEEDKNLCKEVFKSAVLEHMKQAYNDVISTKIPEIFGFKINYSVED